jgi:hypothetical protein
LTIPVRPDVIDAMGQVADAAKKWGRAMKAVRTVFDLKRVTSVSGVR